MLTLLQTAPSGAPGSGPGGALLPGPVDPTLETVGLALLAYGLVQLLGKVLDKLLVSRAPDGAPTQVVVPSFRDEDRKRLAKTFEMLAAERDRLTRVEEAVATIQEQTRWVAEQRTRTDVLDGQPLWNCRARGVVEQLNAQQLLVGQALDELRALNRQNETVLRRLSSVWRRVSRWKRGGGSA
jgi:hypothetical protein